MENDELLDCRISIIFLKSDRNVPSKLRIIINIQYTFEYFVTINQGLSGLNLESKNSCREGFDERCVFCDAAEILKIQIMKQDILIELCMQYILS